MGDLSLIWTTDLPRLRRVKIARLPRSKRPVAQEYAAVSPTRRRLRRLGSCIGLDAAGVAGVYSEPKCRRGVGFDYLLRCAHHAETAYPFGAPVLSRSLGS